MKHLLIVLFFMSISLNLTADVKYKIKSGDTLQQIAGAELGDVARWKEILAINPKVIKGNGNLIFPGDTIRLPSADPEEPESSSDGENTDKPVLAVGYISTKRILRYYYQQENTRLLQGENLDNRGLFTEIVERVFTTMGYKYEVDFMSWSNAMKLSHERGIYDVTFPWYENDERRQNYYYSDPVQPTIVSAFILKDSDFIYTKKSDLRHKKLCRPAGYFTHDISDMVKNGMLTHIAPPTTKDCFEMLLKRQVDLVSEDDQVGNGLLKQLGIDDRIIASNQPMMIRPLHVIFPKRFKEKSIKLRDDFNKGLNQLDQTGELAEIVIRHFEY